MQPTRSVYFKLQTSISPQEERLAVGRKPHKLIIGLPKEQDPNENRIALTPLAVDTLVAMGHEVRIESGAGIHANFTDTDFSEMGAFICETREEIFQSDIVLKVSPCSPEEVQLLRGNQLLISALNIGILSKSYLLTLMKKKVTAIAFELIRDEEGHYPVVSSMSEIIGSTAILKAAEYLSNANTGKGKIVGGISGVNPSEVVILGAGTTAEFAARIALGLGAVVKIFDHSVAKLNQLQRNINQRVFTSIIQPQILRNALATADIFIGAIDAMGENSRFYITEDMVKLMKKGSVIIDTSIDQGGCVETSELTSHEHPIFIKHGIVHYCVPNIPSTVARTASYALSNIFAPLLIRLGDASSMSNLIQHDFEIRHGIYVYKGMLTNYQIGKYFDLPVKDIDILSALL